MSGFGSILLREWLLIVPVVALATLPGLGPSFALARRMRASWGLVALLSFAATLAWLSLATMLAHYLSLSLGFVVIAHAVAAVGSTAWFLWLRGRGPREPRPRDAGLFALSGAAALAALVQQPWWWGTPDTHFHLAAARSLLATGRPLVTDPFFGTASTQIDSHTGVLQPLMAVIARLTSTDVASSWAAITALGAAAVIAGFWLLARETSGSSRAASVATLAYAVGAWFTDFRAFGYPNHVSIGLALLAIALLVRTGRERVRERSRTTLAAAIVAGFATFSMHIASAELVLLAGAAVLLALAAFGQWRELRAVALALALIAAAALPVLLPRVTVLGQTSVVGSDSFVWAGEQIVSLVLGQRVVVPGGFDFGGPWVFGATLVLSAVMARALLRRRDTRTAITLAILLLGPVMTTLPPFSTAALGFSSYMTARMTELLRFAPYVGIAWALGRRPRSETPLSQPETAVRGGAATLAAAQGPHAAQGTATRLLGAVAIAVCLIAAFPYLQSTYVQGVGTPRRGHGYSIAESQRLDWRKEIGVSVLSEVRAVVGDTYPLVATDRSTAYYLMGMVPVAVVPSWDSHTPVFMSRDEVRERVDDMDELVGPDTSELRRRQIVKRWDADYVVVRRTRQAEQTVQDFAGDSAFEIVVDRSTLAMFRVVKDRL